MDNMIDYFKDRFKVEFGESTFADQRDDYHNETYNIHHDPVTSAIDIAVTQDLIDAHYGDGERSSCDHNNHRFSRIIENYYLMEFENSDDKSLFNEDFIEYIRQRQHQEENNIPYSEVSYYEYLRNQKEREKEIEEREQEIKKNEN